MTKTISLLCTGAGRPEYFLDASSDLPEVQRSMPVQAAIMANGSRRRYGWAGSALRAFSRPACGCGPKATLPERGVC